ncbi:MAG TPA: ABC transporter permease [Bacteroidia bacterium]|jgi:ABC-2 type transport system permease protein|nr:ABC transporter permease [Bacteroidia bacterium]
MNFITDAFLLFKRHLKKALRMPIWLVIGLSQPILYLLLYMPLLKNMSAPMLPTADIVSIFVPGMLVIMAMGSLFAGFSFIDEIRQGLISRWLVTPTSRIGIILSLVCNQILTLFLQSCILLVIAVIMGLHVSFMGMLLTLVLVLLIGITMSSFSYAISLSVKDEGVLASITNTTYLPLMLLSGIMLPISLAPNWIKTMALFNPFYYAVEASRSLFAADYGNAIVLKGFIVIIAFTAFALWLAVRALNKMAV